MERIEKWSGKLPVSYLYTAGSAGERFFRNLKEKGTLLASVGKNTKTKYLPPKIYDEQSFAATTEFVDIPPQGKVYSFTTLTKDRRGRPYPQPKILALIQFKGIKGGILHWLEKTKQPRMGMAVKAVLKPAPQREGNIRDILHFAPS